MLKKILFSIILIVATVFFSIAISLYAHKAFVSLGFIKREVSIAGTGSMYPTFPSGRSSDEKVNAEETVAIPLMRSYPAGIKILGYELFPYVLKHDDIVEFDNEATKAISSEKYQKESGFVKRVIALPNDTIELRDGFVKLNGKILDEPFTAKPRSTYGGSSLTDCKALTIPSGYAFVLGDNRKASLDSRYELGLIRLSDIHYVLPWTDQDQYRKLWRDTKDDLLLANTPTLDVMQFVTLLNNKRQEKNLSPYKYNSLLSNSSKIRGTTMIATDDFSSEASKSGVDLKRAISEANYHNIILGEIFTRGFYDADELLENFSEFTQAQKILFSKEYQDIGLSAVVGEIAGCPIQVIVAQLGGYVPPNYSSEEIQSWQKLVDNLEEVLPSWENLRGAEGIDHDKVNQLIDLLNTRLKNAKTILTKIHANQWLTDEENKMVEDDKRLGEEANKVISELKM